MPRKPTLAVFVSDKCVKQYLTDSIRNIIGEWVAVTGWAMDEGCIGPMKADLVVTSGRFIAEEAKAIFPGCPILCSERVLTGRNLEQVLMVAPGKRALVVNHPQVVSEETIQSLRELGIDHLRYESFYRSKHLDPDTIDLVITPGMAHLCPPELRCPVINIGERAISVGTFADILKFFSLDMRYLNEFEHIYILQHVDASRRIKQTLDRSEELRRHQSVILREIDEGILATNQSGRIVIANPIINELFGPTEQLGQNVELQRIIATLSDEATHRDELSESQRSTALLIQHNDKAIYCRKNVLELEGDRQSFYTFKSVDQIQQLEQSVRRRIYHRGFEARHTFSDITGSAPALLRVKEKALRFAATDLTILLTGESGTGKELFAQSIHNASHRANGPFVAVNLAAISRTLLESELFGYQEGAFTGAKKGGKQGFFELAHGGTIFLDEIGDAPLHIQLLLLRVLEAREITRVGGEHNTPIDVRVVAATNKPLEQSIERGRFRQDLYFRLNVLPLRTVPLRDMRDEIPAFLSRLAMSRFGRCKPIAPDVVELLCRHSWPGNLRELGNVVDYLYFSSGEASLITSDDLPDYLLDQLASGGLEARIQSEPVLRAALMLLAEAAPASLGRSSLAERLQAHGFHETEGAVKALLEALREGGAVSTGTTRQGSCITPRGQQLLQEALEFSQT